MKKQSLDRDYPSARKSYLQTNCDKQLDVYIGCNLNRDNYPTSNDESYNYLEETWAYNHFSKPYNTERVCHESIWYNNNILINITKRHCVTMIDLIMKYISLTICKIDVI